MLPFFRQYFGSKSIHDPKIFGKLLVASEVEARLQSCLKTGQRGSSFLKLKLNTSGTWRASPSRTQGTCPAASAACPWSCAKSG